MIDMTYTRRDCDFEFGPDHDHDDEKCAAILSDMEVAWEGDLADALNREAEEAMLGRPLFPNEY